MRKKIAVDLPHSLGAAEARRRIAANIGQLEKHLPGKAGVRPQWDGNRLNLNVGTMGQQIDARIDVGEAIVHVEVDLPPMLSFFAKPIEALLAREGAVLLEDKSKGR
jgi:putative polyhydroxyalkanoate system protein